ncbi:uncharacterized protein LOC114647705 isoform X2 [Erpetoichthys calabaricus]|uniref:uncharacterized protein LOC114647705 isoform X2 n=1 Tax=Erpetoichthys calabaricus TaxID=27687 RepID=UPI002234D4DF|nr:uncharacterized protein LOC114647705 isoform X2 [Erpetoichthys calabaricus]
MAPDDNIPRNSSKTAKEQSNCATMKAEHAVMDLKRSDGTISHCESEKDSGYSDTSSEYLQTDSEDQSRSSSRSSFGNISARQKGVQQKGAAFESIAPVYIVKNVVLKQFTRRPCLSVTSPPVHPLLTSHPATPDDTISGTQNPSSCHFSSCSGHPDSTSSTYPPYF